MEGQKWCISIVYSIDILSAEWRTVLFVSQYVLLDGALLHELFVYTI